MSSATSTTARRDTPDSIPGASSWTIVLSALLGGADLTSAQTAWAMNEIISGAAAPAQMAGFVTALRAKGETPAEVAGLVTALRANATAVAVSGATVDIAGTGGDGTGAVNVSTMAAVVAAAAGVTVVKHGGRSASSSTAGAADLVEYLGIPLDLTPRQAARIAAEAGITFLFAPRFNTGLRHASPVRRDLGVPTVFNLLGPLINPADPRHQVVSVAHSQMAPVVAGVLAADGRSALVVRGDDGLDKLTTSTTSQIWSVRGGTVTATRLDPQDLGFARTQSAALRGGSAAENAGVLRSVVSGERNPVRDVVILNAAAALVASDERDTPLLDQFAAAAALCADAIDTGAAKTTLTRWITASRRITRSAEIAETA
ncbi:anthranilate phosphoribosyltransferase [Actinoplanes sp. LDG1-06]|uniref:Anthranilate phosphoribosyltransferase n=1 Tax=Paractinoplanes ovalisporus TaxID=2810368 RepID=A0ABS2A9I3_9ACTN|nr:anthranilate phosphoribosyltransferase [Actinoplanes ovalisporus]MBM2616499.1 anthranilate phosphoribosyltransferase [Actinoplanes ovalisporus]